MTDLASLAINTYLDDHKEAFGVSIIEVLAKRLAVELDLPNVASVMVFYSNDEEAKNTRDLDHIPGKQIYWNDEDELQIGDILIDPQLFQIRS